MNSARKQEELADTRELGFICHTSTLPPFARNKPASGWRLEKLRRWGLADELPENASMQELVYFFNEVKHDLPTQAQIKIVKELGFKIYRVNQISAQRLEDLLSLQGQPPREEDLEILNGWEVVRLEGDALATYAVRLLVGYFVDLAGLALLSFDRRNCSNTTKMVEVRSRIAPACRIALCDPEYNVPTIKDYGEGACNTGDMVFTWPRHKIREWYREGAQVR